jgi:hypothetical protein
MSTCYKYLFLKPGICTSWYMSQLVRVHAQVSVRMFTRVCARPGCYIRRSCFLATALLPRSWSPQPAPLGQVKVCRSSDNPYRCKQNQWNVIYLDGSIPQSKVILHRSPDSTAAWFHQPVFQCVPLAHAIPHQVMSPKPAAPSSKTSSNL